jgi:Tfp pilus assembly protein FimT
MKMRAREAQSLERSRREGGFTVLQTIIVVAIVAIAASFAFMGIASARTTDTTTTVLGIVNSSKPNTVTTSALGKAATLDVSTTPSWLQDANSAPSFHTNGGGTNDLQYDSVAITNAMNSLGSRVLGVVEK